MIRLHHGSNVKIGVPDLIHSKLFKDFGRGFYLLPDKQQAWSSHIAAAVQVEEMDVCAKT